MRCPCSRNCRRYRVSSRYSGQRCTNVGGTDGSSPVRVSSALAAASSLDGSSALATVLESSRAVGKVKSRSDPRMVRNCEYRFLRLPVGCDHSRGWTETLDEDEDAEFRKWRWMSSWAPDSESCDSSDRVRRKTPSGTTEEKLSRFLWPPPSASSSPVSAAWRWALKASRSEGVIVTSLEAMHDRIPTEPEAPVLPSHDSSRMSPWIHLGLEAR
mmetsp:Transcript_17045/g.46868  ORF Transcript_17045/g.46868 Transcript_17045/m.46868 type:complete len:214 (+) Transcript_17045:335-976(+)